jgi:hypothetical protein
MRFSLSLHGEGRYPIISSSDSAGIDGVVEGDEDALDNAE